MSRSPTSPHVAADEIVTRAAALHHGVTIIGGPIGPVPVAPTSVSHGATDWSAAGDLLSFTDTGRRVSRSVATSLR